MKINLFNFSMANTKKGKARRRAKQFKEYGKECKAVAKLDNNGNFIAVVVVNGKQQAFPFTPASYNLKGKEYIFRKDKHKTNNHVCIIRSESVANISPGLSEYYSPIALNWIYSGKLSEFDGKVYFNIHNAITKEIITYD